MNTSRMKLKVGGLIVGGVPFTLYFFYFLYRISHVSVAPSGIPVYEQLVTPTIITAAAYAGAYFLVYAQIGKRTYHKGLLPAILLGMIVFVAIYLLPFSLSLWISAFVLKGGEEAEYREKTGHSSYETVFSSVGDTSDNSAFEAYKIRKRNIRKLTLYLIPVFAADLIYIFLKYNPFAIIYAPEGSYEAYTAAQGMLFFLILFYIPVLGYLSAASYYARLPLRKIYKFLPGRIGTVLRIFGGGERKCVVAVEGISFAAHYLNQAERGDPVRIINVNKWSRFLTIITLTVERNDSISEV